MFKSTIHGHFNATNTRANGRHRPLDSKHLNMALWPNHAKNTLCASSPVTTSHEPPITAANRDRLHALGPWTGDNESAARRRLRLLQRPPQASTRHSDVLSEVAAMSMSTRECRFTPSARMVMPTLAGVLRVDGR